MDELALLLNVSKQSIYTWERGLKKIPYQRVLQLSEISGIPENYFRIPEVSEQDKVRIKKLYLDKALDDTVDQYANTDSLSNEDFMNLEIDSTLKRIKTIMCTASPAETSIKKEVFDRFADIVNNNAQTEFLYPILRAMDLFFSVDTQENNRPAPTDRVINESPLVRDLYAVLYEHSQRTNEEE